MNLALAIPIGVLVYVVFIVLLLGLFKGARMGDGQVVDAFDRSYDRDLEWPWPPRDKETA